MNKLERLFSPRGIAIVGATEDVAGATQNALRPGGQSVRALKQYGYRGGIYPVNPKYPELAGLRCFGALNEIDGPVDIAVIAVPAAGAVGMVKNCGEAGIPYAVVLGGGFREAGTEGLKLQEEMVAIARPYGVRILGPNCLGVANIHERVFAAFGALARPPLLAPGPVSIVMQSGGFGTNLTLGCRAAGIGFRLVIASGNEADLTAPELIDALIDDPATEIILAYLEGVTDGRMLMSAGERALAAGKPILIWKAGNTRQGARVAATHTANMTGSYDVWRAAFRQCGIIEIREVEQTTDYVRALLAKRLPHGRNVAALSPSGGSAVVFSDAADEYGLTLPKPGGQTAAALRAALPYVHTLGNPVDLGSAGISPRTRSCYLAAVKALLTDADMHQLCLIFSSITGERAAAGAAVLAEAAQASDKPMLVFSSVPCEVATDAFDLLASVNIPILPSPTRLARAAGILADYAEFRRIRVARSGSSGAAPPSARLFFDEDLVRDKSGALDEARSKRIVSACGITVTQDAVLPADDDDAIDAVDVRFPVAVKVLSPDIAHKTDVGGVLLNVVDRAALRVAARAVMVNARRAHPSARIDGVLVSEMIPDAVEVIAGSVNDPVFGPVVLLGMGGVLAEAMHDVTYRVAPFDLIDAHAMVGELRTRRIFDGMRGAPACDVDALAAALVKLSELAWSQRDRISELDINPLMVRPRGRGVVAADALIVLR